MRITNRYLAERVVQSVQGNLSKLARSQEQIATSKRLLRPSDDPNVMGQFIAVKATLSYNVQYGRNIDDGLAYLDMNDAAMQTLDEVLAKAGELATQAANDTYTAEDRAAIAAQIDKMIDEVVDLGNTSIGGKYIYAGMRNNRPPFSREDDKIMFGGDTAAIYREVLAGTDYRVDAPGVTTGVEIVAKNDPAKSSAAPVVLARQDDRAQVGIIELTVDTPPGEVTCHVFDLDGTTVNPDLVINYSYNSDTKLFQVTAGGLAGLEIDFSASASDATYRITLDSRVGVFGNADMFNGYTVYDPATAPAKADADKGIFDTLFALRDRLLANDTAGLQMSIQEIQDTTDKILEYRVQVGARTKHFEALKTQLLDQEVKLTEILDQIEGADMARLSIEASQHQLSYEASLAIGARIMQTSLLDFLR